MAAEAALVAEVRLAVLDAAMRSGKVSDAHTIARLLGREAADVIDAFRHLGEGHIYVVEPGDPSRLRMANPFSAVPTAFRVEVGNVSYFGNCIWDSLGIVSLLGGNGRVLTSCPDCRDPLELRVAGRRLVRAEGVVHFSVPSRHSWDDIVYT